MRPKPPIRYYKVVERLLNRRITLCRDEPDGGYHLIFENCISRQDAAERVEAATAKSLPVPALQGGRILVTQLRLSNEALRALAGLYQHHEKCATERRKERNRRQQLIVSRLAALEEATLNADLRAPESSLPATAPAPPPKPPRKPRAKKGEK